MYPQPQYPPQQYPQYPAPQPAYPQYPQQQYPAPAPVPTTPGSLSAFYEQPSGGAGPSWKFHNKPIGTTYSGIVARPVSNADVRQQTDNANRPVTYKDGRPKFVMVVPMLVQPGPEFPEGNASWWVKGQARDELVRAMAEAGAPEGPPEAGAAVSVQLVGQRPIPGMNPAYQYRIAYRRPDGAVPVTGTAPVTATRNRALTYGPTDAERTPAAAPAQPAAPAPVAQPGPSPLSPEQQALLAKLTGG